jgi:hypothetical protein
VERNWPHFHLMPRLRIGGTIPPLSHMSSWRAAVLRIGYFFKAETTSPYRTQGTQRKCAGMLVGTYVLWHARVCHFRYRNFCVVRDISKER